jgi:hypothetical protein
MASQNYIFNHLVENVLEKLRYMQKDVCFKHVSLKSRVENRCRNQKKKNTMKMSLTVKIWTKK